MPGKGGHPSCDLEDRQTIDPRVRPLCPDFVDELSSNTSRSFRVPFNGILYDQSGIAYEAPPGRYTVVARFSWSFLADPTFPCRTRQRRASRSAQRSGGLRSAGVDLLAVGGRRRLTLSGRVGAPVTQRPPHRSGLAACGAKRPSQNLPKKSLEPHGTRLKRKETTRRPSEG